MSTEHPDRGGLALPRSDEVDRVLSTFFKKELPAPWPPLRLPEPAAPARAGRLGPAAPSRLALAASVAVLLGLCWFLLGRGAAPLVPGAAPAGEPGLIRGAEAAVPGDLKPDEDLFTPMDDNPPRP